MRVEFSLSSTLTCNLNPSTNPNLEGRFEFVNGVQKILRGNVAARCKARGERHGAVLGGRRRRSRSAAPPAHRLEGLPRSSPPRKARHHDGTAVSQQKKKHTRRTRGSRPCILSGLPPGNLASSTWKGTYLVNDASATPGCGATIDERMSIVKLYLGEHTHEQNTPFQLRTPSSVMSHVISKLERNVRA